MQVKPSRDYSDLINTLKSIVTFQESGRSWITDTEGKVLVESSEIKKNLFPDFEKILRKHKIKVDSAFPAKYKFELDHSFNLKHGEAVIISATQLRFADQFFYLFALLNPSNDLLFSPQNLIAEEFGIYVWQFNLTQNRFYLPAAATKQFFSSEKESIDYHDFYTSLSPESLHQFSSAMERAINFGQNFKLDLMFDLPRGFKWVSFSCFSTRDTQNSSWLTGLIKDLTQERIWAEKNQNLDTWLNAGLAKLEVENEAGKPIASWGTAEENPRSHFTNGKRVTTLVDFRNRPKYKISAELGFERQLTEERPLITNFIQEETIESKPVQLYDTQPEITSIHEEWDHKCVALTQWLGQSLDGQVTSVGVFDGSRFEWKAWWKSANRFALPTNQYAGEWLPELSWLIDVETDLESGSKPIWWPQDLLPFAIPDTFGVGWMLLADRLSEKETAIFAIQSQDPKSLMEKTNHVVKGLDILRKSQPESENLVKKLQAQIAEKEFLLKELNHRAKNNISLATSLVKMQAAFSNDDTSTNLLKQTQKRLEVISSLHELMYQSPDTTNFVDMKVYLSRLINGLVGGFANDNLTLELNLDPIELDVKVANTVGMLVNELVSNAFKHALSIGSGGILKIDFLQKGNSIKLRVSDNGPGFDEEDNNKESFGQVLINEFVSQLKGTIEILNAAGTTYLITFKK